MADEIPPVEVQDPPPENPPQVQAETPAPPPAARLVVRGEKSEREIELEQQLADTGGKLTEAERRILEREREIAEREREIQELKKIPREPGPKPKRNRIFPTFFDDE